MRLFALLLLLGVAQAQGLSKLAPGQKAKVSGPLVLADANVVSHVYWSGTALVDAKSLAWTMAGTVPQVAPSSLLKPPRAGAGAFSGSNYYSLASPNALNFAGDHTVCVVFKGPTAASTRVVGSFGSVGWRIGTAATGTAAYANSSSTIATSGNTISVGAINVVCGGRASGNAYVKLNLGTTVSYTGAMTADTSTATIIGTTAALTVPFPDVLFEFYATSTAWDESTVAAIQTRVRSRIASPAW